MFSSSLTSKGQVTVPVKLRQHLDLHAGDTLVFEQVDSKILIFKQKKDITSAFGLYRVPKKVSQEDIQKAIEEGYTDDRR